MRRLLRKELAIGLGAGVLLLAPAVAGIAGGGTPDVDAVLGGTPGDNGWWKSQVTLQWTVSPADAVIVAGSCIPETFVNETAGETRSCSASNGSGSASSSVVIKIDKTAPSATGASTDRSPDGDGWFNHTVSISFNGSDGMSGIDSCSSATYGGPDTSGTSVSGSCRDKAGHTSGSTSFGLKYDATAPEVTGATPDRPPDANGWYNHGVTFSLAGSDGLSGIASCDAPAYAGPDGEAVSVSGSCRDKAGNTSAAKSFGLKYDQTPPAPAQMSADAGNRLVKLSWQGSPDSQLFELVRVRGNRKTPVYRGEAAQFQDRELQNGVKYHYELTSFDQAGNPALAGVDAMPQAPLYLPKAGARVSSAPLLAWQPVKGAPFYNVQVTHEGRKIASFWPKRPRFRLKRAWVFEGTRYVLEAGRYDWFVWPAKKGGGRKYGKLLGRNHFVVVRR